CAKDGGPAMKVVIDSW
nr:immunoglobulin heavy chain junction region [Macaca mulatta]